jgi:hypothetical protein
LIAASSAGAQNVGSGQTGGSVAFVRDAGNAGQFEVQSSRLALERSQHVGVRGYAGQTVKDADEMINRVKFINSQVGASMPDSLQPTSRRSSRNSPASGPVRPRYALAIAVGELLKTTFTDTAPTAVAHDAGHAAKAVTD